jgi:hypothetical protein
MKGLLFVPTKVCPWNERNCGGVGLRLVPLHCWNIGCEGPHTCAGPLEVTTVQVVRVVEGGEDEDEDVAKNKIVPRPREGV